MIEQKVEFEDEVKQRARLSRHDWLEAAGKSGRH